MNAWREIGQALKGVAPALATAFLGPAGGIVARTALNAVSGATGAPGAKPEQVLSAIRDGSVDLAKLKQADTDFEARMQELGIDLERIHQEDRASARRMRVKLGGDTTSSVLAYLAVAMFGGLIGLIGYMAIRGIEPGQDMKELIIFVLGHASGFAMACYTFYFGSSSGERKAGEEKP